MRSVTVRFLVAVALAGAATVFAVQNGGVRVPVRLGVTTVNGVSLPVIVFVAVLLGMLLVFLAGLRADMRTRRMMRRYRDALGGSPEEN